MMKKKSMLITALLALCFSLPAKADDIYVAVSIKPLHSLVQMVLGGLGDAVLLMDGNTSPHNATLLPSTRRHLARADMVVLIDPLFEMSYAKALNNDGGGRRVLLASSLDGIRLLDRRTSSHNDHNDHDEHDDHTGDQHHHNKDLHLWLAADNAVAIINGVRDGLMAVYPEHGEVLAANAEAAAGRILAMDRQVAALFAEIKSPAFIVYHDAYIYFEDRYGFAATASILNHHDAPAEVGRVSFLRRLVEENNIKCIFHEPQFSAKILNVIDPDEKTTTVALDPIGAKHPKGAGQYEAMMREMAQNLHDCLTKP